MSDYVIAMYLRLSSEDTDLKQSDKLESNSISNQRNLLKAHISRMPEFSGAKVVEFCDDGWSGKSFDRPAIQELLIQVKQGNIQCIVVKDLSRFGRDYLEVGNYISRIFPFLGVRFIAVNDGFDSIRPLDVDSLETSFKTLIYDLYSRELSRKVRGSMKLKAEKGRYLSAHTLFGYKKDDSKKHLVIDPPAAEIVRRIFQMFGDGIPASKIAKALNSEGIPTPMKYKVASGRAGFIWGGVDKSENFWTSAAVIRTIRSEQYLGKMVFGKRFYDQIGQGHSIKVSKDDWIVVENAHEPIVSQAEFDRAQAALRKFTKRPASQCSNLFSRKIRCGICGHFMSRKEGKQPYYICQTSRVTDRYTCSAEHILEADVLDAVHDGLLTIAMAAVEISEILENKRQAQKQYNTETAKKILRMKELLEQKRSEAKGIYESFALAEISKSEYLSQKAAIQLKCEEITAEISGLEASLNCREDCEQDVGLVDSFKKYAGTQELTKEIIGEVLKEVRIYPGRRMEIVWNYQDEIQKMLDTKVNL